MTGWMWARRVERRDLEALGVQSTTENVFPGNSGDVGENGGTFFNTGVMGAQVGDNGHLRRRMKKMGRWEPMMEIASAGYWGVSMKRK